MALVARGTHGTVSGVSGLMKVGVWADESRGFKAGRSGIVSGTGTWVWVPVSKDENRETEVSNHGGRGPHRDSLFV